MVAFPQERSTAVFLDRVQPKGSRDGRTRRSSRVRGVRRASLRRHHVVRACRRVSSAARSASSRIAPLQAACASDDTVLDSRTRAADAASAAALQSFQRTRTLAPKGVRYGSGWLQHGVLMIHRHLAARSAGAAANTSAPSPSGRPLLVRVDSAVLASETTAGRALQSLIIRQ